MLDIIGIADVEAPMLDIIGISDGDVPISHPTENAPLTDIGTGSGDEGNTTGE